LILLDTLLHYRFLYLSIGDWFLLGQAGSAFFCGFLAKLLDPFKDGPDDRFWIKPVNLFVDGAVGVVDGSVGEGGTPDVLHAMLRVPCAVEVVDVKAPLPFVLQ
jgi:hypothetical protein